jgi:hypothetical protein
MELVAGLLRQIGGAGAEQQHGATHGGSDAGDSAALFRVGPTPKRHWRPVTAASTEAAPPRRPYSAPPPASPAASLPYANRPLPPPPASSFKSAAAVYDADLAAARVAAARAAYAYMPREEFAPPPQPQPPRRPQTKRRSLLSLLPQHTHGVPPPPKRAPRRAPAPPSVRRVVRFTDDPYGEETPEQYDNGDDEDPFAYAHAYDDAVDAEQMARTSVHTGYYAYDHAAPAAAAAAEVPVAAPKLDPDLALRLDGLLKLQAAEETRVARSRAAAEAKLAKAEAEFLRRTAVRVA